MAVELHTVLGLVLAALLAGWVDAVVGGGGLIQLPALLIGLPKDTAVATISGTNKFSSAFGTATATATYLRKVSIQWRGALPLMACAWLGSTLGAQLVKLLPRQAFTPIVLVVLIVVGTYTVRRPQLGLHQELRHDGRAHWLRLAMIGLVIGAYDGFIGPGTGTFFVIALVALMGYGFLEATALTKLANLTTNIAAITVLGLSGHILWGLGAAMAAANLTGGLLGARMAIRHGNAFVRKVFLVVVSLLAVKLAVDTFAMLT